MKKYKPIDPVGYYHDTWDGTDDSISADLWTDIHDKLYVELNSMFISLMVYPMYDTSA